MSAGRTKITPHFALGEFACHDGTPYPVEWVESRLRQLCELLEEIRREVKAPVRVLSGYRTPVYNRRIGGARASQHVEGRAADIIVDSMTVPRLHAAILDLHRTDVGAAALGGLGRYPGFVHVDVRIVERLARWTGGRLTA